MSSPELDADILIVGAGPVGLTLANLLGTYGVSTIVIERNASTVGEPRAVSIDDETLRTMQAVGLDAAVLRDVVQAYGVQYFSWRGKPLAQILPTRQEFGFPKRNAFRQVLFERSLREGAERFPHVRLLFNHELLSFAEEGDGVVAEVRNGGEIRALRGAWLIGCDGGRSPVRERLGISMEGSTYPERWLIVDLDGRTSPLRHTQTFCDPVRPAIRLPGPHATLRYEFMLRPHEDEAFALDEARFRGWVAARHPEDAGLNLVRKVVYTFHARVAATWRRGRVFLAGDAAHLSPPFAGQGLNSGIRDAFNLGWKLAAVLKWGAPVSLLDTYEPERRPHAAALIRMALRIGVFMQPKSKLQASLMQGALRLACLIPAARDYILQLKFKPKPHLTEGFFEKSPGADFSEMLPQPLVELSSRNTSRLDALLGTGFAIIGWDSPQFRKAASTHAPLAGAPARAVALTRVGDDFLGEGILPEGMVQARDPSGMLDAFFDRLKADALVVRPDRYWSRVIRF